MTIDQLVTQTYPIECQGRNDNGQRCKASHSDIDKQGDGIFCPCSFDI